MERQEYFDKIKAIRSPLLLLDKSYDLLTNSQTNSLINIDIYLDIANKLKQRDNIEAKTRGEFIKMQCNGLDSENFFLEHCESWGIPIFEENILTASDFKNGFLNTFRDHSTSWCEDQEAREWFYTNIEAHFVKRYEFWACDNGPDEMLLHEVGDYKSILWILVKKHQHPYALISPTFSYSDLKNYLDAYDPEEVDIEKEELLELLEQNPNWST